MPVKPVGDQRFSDDVEHRKPGIQRRHRILKHHLQFGPQLATGGCVEGCDVVAENLDGTGLGCGELENLAQRRRFARTGFADDAQSAALLQGEADPVDRTNFTDPPAQNHAFGQWVGLGKVGDSQYHRGVRDGAIARNRLR